MAQGIVDVTHLLDREDGTAFDDTNVLFADYGDGAVFNYDEAQARDYAKMLEVDGKARTLEAVLALPIRRASKSIRRGEASSDVTKFVESAFFAPANNGGMSTTLETVVAQMAGAAVFKKAFFEKVLTRRDVLGTSRVTYDKVAWRPASTCTILRDKRTAAFQGFRQRPIREGDQQDIRLPPQRAFVYINGTHRSPLEGTSDLEIAYWCYQTKQKIRFLWYQFLEGQSLPKTIVRHADSQEKADAIAKKVIGLRSGGVASVYGDAETLAITPFESSGRGASQFKEALQWLDAEASGSVLAGFTDLGAAAAGGTGSFALSKDQTDFFLINRQASAREMQDAINQFLIPDLVRYNFGAVPSPTFEFGPIAEDDASLAATMLQTVNVNPTGSFLPREFLEELTERVAGYLDLNTNKVRKGLDRAAKEAAEKAAATSDNPVAPAVAGVAGAVSAATSAVQQATTPPGAPVEPAPGQRLNGNPARVRQPNNADPSSRRLRPA